MYVRTIDDYNVYATSDVRRFWTDHTERRDESITTIDGDMLS